MICRPCKNKDHETCKQVNVNKMPSACDCQHRVEQKSIVLPESTKLELVKIFQQ